MPTLDWLDRDAAFRIAERVPTRVLRPHAAGGEFGALPRLCYRLPAGQGQQGELALLERDAVFDEVELNLLGEAVSLPGFTMAEQARAWQVYLDGQKLRVGRGDAGQLALDAVRGTITEDDLARWLSAELQHPARNAARDVLPAHLRAFVLASVRHLVHEQRIPLEQLARHQHALVQRLVLRIAQLRDEASHGAFRQLVLEGGWTVEASARYNLDSDPSAGFWLPTSFGRFYPDFVCELMDGRLFVVEYKGAQIRGMAKEIEKAQVGKLWAESSGGRCLFVFVYLQEGGRDMAQQLDAALA